MRYCHKCYEVIFFWKLPLTATPISFPLVLQIRKGWLDPRPKRRRPKKTRDENGSIDTIPSTSSVSSTASSAVVRGDSIVSTRTVDSGISSQSSYEEEALPSCSVGSQKQPCNCSTDLCELCGLRPVDGAFMHGNTGHQLYCYSCSKRVWRERKKCPVCRRTIAKVAKMFKVTSSWQTQSPK